MEIHPKYRLVNACGKEGIHYSTDVCQDAGLAGGGEGLSFTSQDRQESGESIRGGFMDVEYFVTTVVKAQ